jgi:hypothetical protein
LAHPVGLEGMQWPLSMGSLVFLALAVPIPASAWNIPGHMLSAAITYQVLQQENPGTIEKVKAVLEKHPWFTNQWWARLQDVPGADHGRVLFMQAARWAETKFGARTSNTIGDRGSISIGPLNPRGNQRAYRSETPTR